VLHVAPTDKIARMVDCPTLVSSFVSGSTFFRSTPLYCPSWPLVVLSPRPFPSPLARSLCAATLTTTGHLHTHYRAPLTTATTHPDLSWHSVLDYDSSRLVSKVSRSHSTGPISIQPFCSGPSQFFFSISLSLSPPFCLLYHSLSFSLHLIVRSLGGFVWGHTSTSAFLCHLTSRPVSASLDPLSSLYQGSFLVSSPVFSKGDFLTPHQLSSTSHLPSSDIGVPAHSLNVSHLALPFYQTCYQAFARSSRK
jgi:hypothetical protein